MQAEHPDLPEAVLRAYFEHEAEPAIADIREALDCDEAQAEGWRKMLAVRLVSPAAYSALFAAQEAVRERQRQWQRYEDDVRATAAELAAVHQAIELKRAESHLPAYEAEATKELARLDEDDARLRRKTERLPGTGRLVEAKLAEATAALEQAEALLHQEEVEAFEQVQASWRDELVRLLEPLEQHLAQAAWLTQRGAQLQLEPGHGAYGQEWLRTIALARLRR
jgi:hypothetical protein